METIQHSTIPLQTKQKNDLQRLLYGGFWIRLIAYLVDLAVLWAINSIITRPIIGWLGLEEAELWIPMFSAENMATTILFFLYFYLLTYYFSATLGKMIFGLSVESINHEPMTASQVLFREFIGRYISMALLGLPYIVVAFTKRHQGIHDLFADTSVIKEKFRDLNKAIVRE